MGIGPDVFLIWQELQVFDWLGGDEGHKGPVDALALLLRGAVP